MHVIRHHHPGQQVVVFAMVEAQCTVHQGADFRPSQVALATSTVEVGFELFVPFPFILDGQHGLPLPTQGGRERISQTESYKLRQARLVAVRQITAFMPAREAKQGMLAFRRGRMALFVGHKLAHAGIMRRTGSFRAGLLPHGLDLSNDWLELTSTERSGPRPVPGRSTSHRPSAPEKLPRATPISRAAVGDRPRSGPRPVPGRSTSHCPSAPEELSRATPTPDAAVGDRPRSGPRPVPGRSASHRPSTPEELPRATPTPRAAVGDRPRSGPRPVPGRSASHRPSAPEELPRATPIPRAAVGDRPRSGPRPVPGRSVSHCPSPPEKLPRAAPHLRPLRS